MHPNMNQSVVWPLNITNYHKSTVLSSQNMEVSWISAYSWKYRIPSKYPCMSVSSELDADNFQILPFILFTIYRWRAIKVWLTRDVVSYIFRQLACRRIRILYIIQATMPPRGKKRTTLLNNQCEADKIIDRNILRLSGDIFGLPHVNVKCIWIYKIYPDVHPYISWMYVLDLIFNIDFNIKINCSDN